MTTRPPLFILNCGRSGSTLLKSMLDRHCRIFAPGELNLWSFSDLEEAREHFRFTSLFEGVVGAYERLDGESTPAKDHVASLLDSRTSIPEVVDDLVRRSRGRTLVDKSPVHAGSPRALSRIAEYRTPDGDAPRFVFLVRHPLDVASSMLRRNYDRLLKLLDLNAARAAQRRGLSERRYLTFGPASETFDATRLGMVQANYIWVNRLIMEFLRHTDYRRQVTVRYEDLVARPQPELQKICRLLDLDFEPSMLDPYGRANGERLGYEEVGDPGFHAREGIERSLAGAWKRDERFQDAGRFDPEFLEFGRELGYEMPGRAPAQTTTPAQRAYRDAGFAEHTVIHVAWTMHSFERSPSETELRAALDWLVSLNPELRDRPPRNEDRFVARDDARFDVDDHLTVLDCRTGERSRATWIASSIERTRGRVATRSRPHFHVTMLRRAENEYEVHYHFDHMIADGVAIARFHRDLWNAVTGHAGTDLGRALAGCQLPRHRAPEGGRVAGLNDAHAEVLRRTVAEITSAMGPKERTLLARNRQSRVRSVRERRCVVRPKVAARSRFHRLAHALFVEVTAFLDSPHVSVAHRLNRRSSARTRSFGFVAGDHIVSVDASSLGNVRDFARAHRDQRRHAVERSLAHDELRASGELPAPHALCAFRLNHVVIPRDSFPGLDFRTPGFDLHRSEDMPNDYVVDCIVRDAGDEVQIVLRYNSDCIRDDWARTFHERWASSIGEISVSGGVGPEEKSSE